MQSPGVEQAHYEQFTSERLPSAASPSSGRAGSSGSHFK